MSNTKEIVPIKWHFTCQVNCIYENFKEQHFRSKYKLTVWKILIFLIKMIWKRMWMTWLGCTRQCKKNWNSIIYRTNPNSYLGTWMYCSEYFNVFEYLVGTSHEIKKVGVILGKPAPKKGKSITTKTLHLVTNVYEDDSFSR